MSAFLCLMFSSIFHLFYPQNERIYKILLRLDYAGVTILTSGCSFPPYYYGFYCKLHFGLIYISILTTISLVAFILSMQDFLHTKAYFRLKSFIYGLMGASTFMPVAHLIIEETYLNDNNLYSTIPSLTYYGFMYLFFFIGLILYTFRCPERCMPGRFDLCGASH